MASGKALTSAICRRGLPPLYWWTPERCREFVPNNTVKIPFHRRCLGRDSISLGGVNTTLGLSGRDVSTSIDFIWRLKLTFDRSKASFWTKELGVSFRKDRMARRSCLYPDGTTTRAEPGGLLPQGKQLAS